MMSLFYSVPKDVRSKVNLSTLFKKKNSTNSTNTPKNIFCYFLDSNKKKSQVAELVKNHFNIEVNTFDNNITQKLNFGEWLNSFKSSKFVITDSFHGVVFSLIFRKQFIAIGSSFY